MQVAYFEHAREAVLMQTLADHREDVLPWDSDRCVMIETLKNPDMLNVDASEMRIESALKPGVLAPALDAAKAAVQRIPFRKCWFIK